MANKPLSKSRFKIGIGCPTKLYYSVRKEYGNRNDQDEFLKALAEGGYQVGELAMLYYPGGTKVETLDYDESVRQTDELLKQENVVIYEAAFRHENLFVRVDILVKRGNIVELIEVKAKSFDSTQGIDAFNKAQLKKGQYQLKDEWGDYLMDLAFQTYVLQKAKPEFKVNPGLMMADKSKRSTVDGLNQLFLIKRDENGRVAVQRTRDLKPHELGEPLLTRVELGEVVRLIIEKAKVKWADNFENLVAMLSGLMASGAKFSPDVDGKCKGCEFKVAVKKFPAGTKSGFHECWAEAKGLKPSDFEREFIFDVWQFRAADTALAAGKIFAADLTDKDLTMKERVEARVAVVPRLAIVSGVPK